jgi:hypothetical protein
VVPVMPVMPMMPMVPVVPVMPVVPMMPMMPVVPVVPVMPMRLGARCEGGQANKHRGRSQETFGHVDYPQCCDSKFASRPNLAPPTMNSQ